MAMKVIVQVLGVDVSKDWLDISHGNTVWRIDNRAAAIERYLRTLAGVVRIAIEPTGAYHQRISEAALALGHEVYLVDPYRLSRYREAVGVRVKTDVADAQLLARYLAAEYSRLRPFRLAPKAVSALQALLRARARVTEVRTTLNHALAEMAELGPSKRALLKKLNDTLVVIDGKLLRHIQAAGYEEDYRRCLSIPGIGPLNGAGLVAIFHRNRFRSANAFIAFLGLDVRVRESGKYKGQRKLTKRGNPELRRLLFNAARSAARTARWQAYYQALRQRGLSTTAAYVALARKLARLAFALLRDQTTYRAPATA